MQESIDLAYRCAHYVYWTFSNPVFYIGTGIILLIERWLPAKPFKKGGVGFAQDVVWVAVQGIISVALIATYTAFLTAVYKEHLDFLTLQSIAAWPMAAKFVLWFLAVDFSEWFHHWVRHKVPWFWQFHAVHHSQTELNLFTDLRYHAFEYIVSRTLTVFPLLMLQADIYGVLYFSMVHDWYTRLYHANIRSDFGFLRYILVTPQSHRVHHSIETRHHDKNFGVIFSFWDALFGTQHRGWEEYPDTGVRDKEFPLERSMRGLSLFLTPVHQHVYPFKAIWKNTFGRKD